MKKAQMNISHFRFILFKLKIFGEIVTTFNLIPAPSLKYIRYRVCFNFISDLGSNCGEDDVFESGSVSLEFRRSNSNFSRSRYGVILLIIWLSYKCGKHLKPTSVPSKFLPYD